MPAPQWPQPVAVIRQLLEAPHGFDFFQAVRLLELWWAREEGLTRSQMLATRLAFRNSISLSFPASEIESLRVVWRDLNALADDAHGPGMARRLERLELTPAFISLLGTGGTLPTWYTELLTQRESEQRDNAARAFLDIFLHRTVALFYEAWRKHRLAVQYEGDRRHRFLPLMLSVAGIGDRRLRNQLSAGKGGVADDALALFAGSLQRRPVSARVLQQVLSHYFRIPVRLEQFIGRWFTLPRANQSTLGMSNMQLGRNLVVGERVWQRDLRVRLTLGPLSGDRYTRFLPGGAGALALRELLALLGGPTLEYEVRLQVQANELRGISLSGAQAPRLGWDTFLLTETCTGTRDDAGYDLLALA